MSEPTKKESEERVKPRVYRGKEVTVDQLEPGQIVQVLVRKQASYSTSMLPLFMRITGVAPYAGGGAVVTYQDPRNDFKVGAWYSKNGTVVNLLTGTQGAKLAVEYSEWAKSRPPPAVKPTLGADPELFVDVGGVNIPSWKFLRSKADKVMGQFQIDGHIYWDGFQAEFDTRSQTCLGYLNDEFQQAMQSIVKAAHDAGFKGARITPQSVIPVDPDVLESADEKHVEFGCMPSYNAYGLDGLKAGGRETPFRFAGGHLHFGMPKLSREKAEQIVMALDATVGLASVALFAGHENPIRRIHYGLAGEYRLPPHGLEYRVLPNTWLHHPVLSNMVYEIARRGIALSMGHEGYYTWDRERVIRAIQESDVELARALLVEYKAPLIGLMEMALPNPQLAFQCIMGGMDSFLKRPNDIHYNWNLGLRGENGYWVNHCDGTNKNWRFAMDALAAKLKI